MIIRRQLYANNNVPLKKMQDSGIELKPIFKKIAQPTINKPPHTASADNSSFRDADDLLKPIAQQRHREREEESAQQNQNSRERTERNLWRNDEVMEMLYTMQQVKALEKLNDKTVKSENVFKDVEVIMHKNGFVKKSHVQIWTKWKFLKSTYMTSRRNGIIPRMVPPQIYDTIHKMITGLNQSLADSCSSIDGDTSSVSGMVISGVEGGVSDVGATNGDDEDSFVMAHPIFGFRLGTVKSEPEDTGYEAVENGSNNDPLEDELCASKSEKIVKEESNSTAQQATSKTHEPVQKVLEIPHRGRGRPPKNPPTATSTPNNTPAQMPPLRVAPFAKAIHSANAISLNRPPPPLTVPPTTCIRLTNFSNIKNDDPVKFVQPKLTPKPTHQQPSPSLQAVRLPKEITLQTRSSSTPSPSYPKLKQIPMRKTPYSLRPDRAIPDLEASLSPPPPAIEKPVIKKSEELPSTRHLSTQNNTNNFQHNMNRKRRPDWQEPLPTKQAKYNERMDDNGKKYSEVLQNVIADFSSSLLRMQSELMHDFFKKQTELVEKEHKFQMQQDQLIMEAFQEQTQEIMNSVKQLVGGMKTYKIEQQTKRVFNEKQAKVRVKKRMRDKQAQELEEEPDIEEQQDHTQANNDEEVENEVEEEDEMEEQENDHEIEQDLEDIYTDGEEQQNEIVEDYDNGHDQLENNDVDDEEANNHNKLQTINGQTAEEHDDESNNPIDDNHSPTNMMSNEINEK